MAIFDGTSTRTLRINSTAIPVFLGAPALEPVRLQGHEGLNGLFEYELLLKTPDALNLGASHAADWDLNGFIGREISCVIELDGTGEFVPGVTGAALDHLGAGTREINAIVTAAQLWGEEGRHIQYRLTLRPWLYLATRNADVKILQNKTVIDIIDELLAEYPFPVEKRLIGTYAPKDYQTQFNENDYAFFLRLTQRSGISFFFAHDDGKHRLVLIDDLGGYRDAASTAYRQVPYHPPGWKTDAEYVHRFVLHHQLTSGSYATTDYDYTRPRADLRVGHADPRPTGHAGGEVYQWHDGAAAAHYVQPRAGTAGANDPLAEGRNLALLRMQALRTDGARAKAGGNLRGMVPGRAFRLTGHPRAKANVDYLVLDTEFLIEDVAQDSQIKDATPERRQRWRVQVDFVAHPLSEPLRPALTQPKPYSHGPQVAVVVGPPGENLWTDELGRIKVQFPWDRHGDRNANSSCWIRDSSYSAGNQLGGAHVARIGQEVIIDFIGGDPDLPICRGHVHNQLNLPPWELPSQSALSGLRSRELTREGGNSAAGRSNHLVLDDTDQQIQVQLKSDHQSSSLSLGHVTRIDGHAGRQDPRGEGAELRTDGHLVARSGKGMLLTTEVRPDAKAHITDMAETLDRLDVAREAHEDLAEAARQSKAQDPGDQDDVAQALSRQHDALKGPPAGKAGPFPEFQEPHLILASPAGIESTTAGSTHMASTGHNAFTSGGHTSVSAGKSFMVSVRQSVRLFAFKAGIKLVAAGADVDITALQHSINILAKLDITQTAERITITAKEELVLSGGTSYSRWNRAGIEHSTEGAWVTHVATHGVSGPRSVPAPTLDFAQPYQAQYVLRSAVDGSPLPRYSYKLRLPSGRVVAGQTDDQGETLRIHSAQAAEVALHARKPTPKAATPWRLAGGGGPAIAADYLDDGSTA